MTDKSIVFDQVSFRYDEQLILEDVSFDMKQGEKIAILGANGSGKSTLMKLLSGLEAAESGTIKIKSEIIDQSNIQTLREICGIVFQNPNDQFVGSTVIDDIAFGLENHQMPHEEMESHIQTILHHFDLSEFGQMDPASLSGGQKQRAAIAAVAVLQPEILIFDESTSMLDPKHRQMFFDIIERMKTEHPDQIQLMITHDLNEILYFDRILVLGNKKIVFDGALNTFLQFDEETLKMWNLDLPYALRIAKTLASDVDQVKKHYFEILQRTRV
ncbi:MAG: energy-coupling factor transporter ATPase [Culicoidibacterales bacterium]